MRCLLFIVASVLLGASRALAAESPLRITEFAAGGHQRVLDEDGETPDWIEIRNVTAEDVSLSGWTLGDDSKRRAAWKFPATNMPAGGFMVVFASAKDRRVPGRYLHTDFKLKANGGSLFLRGPGGETSGVPDYPEQVAGITYGLAGVAGDEEGAPVQFGPDKEMSYLAGLTAGRTNTYLAGTGPRISEVAHSPSPRQPEAGEPIQVTASVAPFLGGVAKVTLRYRVMFGTETEAPMFDDGKHGDAKAGDGIYGATIPAKTAKAGQMVRFCVAAVDEGGRRSRWPLFASRRGYSAYLGTVMADPAVRSRLPVLQLFSPEGREDGLGGRVSLFYQGELYDGVGIARHGQISRGFPKGSYNVEFPYDQRFRYQTNQPRVHEIKLLGNYADKSKIRNTLAYELIATSGSVSHLAFPVRVQNNGKFFSVAEMVEDGDERWLERVGRDPGGALYKMYNSLSGGGGGEKKTRKQEDHSDLARLASAVSEGKPLEDRAGYAYDHIDIPQCVSYLVSMMLVSSADNGHKNYYLYRDTRGTGEWALFPWDVDLSLGRNWTGQYFDDRVFANNPLILRSGGDRARNRLYNLFFDYPEFRQMCLRRLRTVMDEVLQPPGTPPESLIIERRVRELIALLDPPGIKPSDAARDDDAWPDWGSRSSMRAEAERIINEHLPGRRNFLFRSARATLMGDRVPAAQPADAIPALLEVATTAPLAEQYICLTNRSDIAIDLTNWRLAGGGIEHRFRPGTVIPTEKAIYVVANTRGFRGRSTGPGGRQYLFVQGNWKGRLQSGKGNLQLLDAKGKTVASFKGP